MARKTSVERSALVEHHRYNASAAALITAQRSLERAGTGNDLHAEDRTWKKNVNKVAHGTWQRSLLTALESIEIVIASLVAGVAYHALFYGYPGPITEFVAVGLLTATFYGSVMHGIEARAPWRDLTGSEALRDMALVWFSTILFVTFFAFSLKAGASLSRGTLLAFALLGYAGLLVVRTTYPLILNRHFRHFAPASNTPALVIGAEGHPAFAALVRELQTASGSVLQVVCLNPSLKPTAWQSHLRGSLSSIFGLARVSSAGDICISAAGFSPQSLKELIVALQVVPRSVRVVPPPALEQFLHFPIQSIGGIRSVELQKSPLNQLQTLVKRLIDIVIAALCALLLLPFLGLVVLAIKLESPGPAIFKQTRLGYRGRPFKIFKFRTMTVTEDGPQVRQAQRNDQRLTRIGGWLRKLSIDELPQIANVLRGEMSLVGPRPHAVAHDALYAETIDNYEIRQHVKPGITGWAQVNGFRGETPDPELMQRRVEYDIWYAKNASVVLDVVILLRTTVELFRQRNAY